MNNIEKLIKLIQENPDLPVIPMVDYEIVADDDYQRWMGSIGDPKIGDFCIWNDKIYTDKQNLVEDLIDEKYFFSEETDDEILKSAQKEADKIMFKAIILNIDLPDNYE